MTKVYASFYYYDSGTQVYGGGGRYDYCYWLPEWENLACNYDWQPNGPSYVYNNTSGQFEDDWGNNWHWHKAQFDAWPGGQYNWWCQHAGQVSGLLSWACYGEQQ